MIYCGPSTERSRWRADLAQKLIDASLENRKKYPAWCTAKAVSVD